MIFYSLSYKSQQHWSSIPTKHLHIYVYRWIFIIERKKSVLKLVETVIFLLYTERERERRRQRDKMVTGIKNCSKGEGERRIEKVINCKTDFIYVSTKRTDTDSQYDNNDWNVMNWSIAGGKDGVCRSSVEKERERENK